MHVSGVLNRVKRVLPPLAAGGIVAFVAGAHAQFVADPTFPHLQGLDMAASQEEVAQATGGVTYAMVSCPAHSSYAYIRDARSVSATLARVPRGFSHSDRLVAAILRDAATYVWINCPMPYIWLDGKVEPDFHYNVDRISLYGDGQELARAGIGSINGNMMSGDQPLASSHVGYGVHFFENLLAQREEADARSAAQAEEQRAQAVARANAEAQDRERQQEAAEAGRRFWHGVGTFFTWCFWIGVLAVLWFMRETLVRWYFELQPHPAKGAVDRILRGGGTADGATLEGMLRAPAGRGIEQEVRARQALALAKALRLRAEAQAAQYKRDFEQALADERYREAQRNLAAAVEAQAVAEARLNGLRKARTAYGL